MPEISAPIDLRSDTVTRPSPGMRRAMAEAPVGDDQYGEDPSVNRLQERIAELLGKEAALFVPSGTMANQIGLKLLTRPGDDVVVGEEPHIVWHEAGAAAANSGIQFTTVGKGGLFTAADFRAAYKPPGHIVYPPTTVVAIENTHNRGGGVVFPQKDAAAIAAVARELGVGSYLDGARLFNAAAASGRTLAELAVPFDVVSVALSKGLGCPVGSLVAGDRATTAVELDLATVQTNIVIFHLRPGAPDAAAIVARAREARVLVSAFAARTVRAVTHLDVGPDECGRAAELLAAVIERG